MDNHTRKLLGLEEKNNIFDENWLEKCKVIITMKPGGRKAPDIEVVLN